jgi:hypothetical protein
MQRVTELREEGFISDLFFKTQVDDLEGKDQPSAEVVDHRPGLKNEDRPRQARPPAGEHTSERPAHLPPAAGWFPVNA